MQFQKMTTKVNNNAFEVILSPSSNKRKRSGEFTEPKSGFSNEGFTSTPKKETKVRFGSLIRMKKATSAKNCPTDPCLEVKSIAELAGSQEKVENPYEVVRKPPKKKKKHDFEEVCFENPALNLNCPEKKFNPFEVRRELVPAMAPNCFSNPGLNIQIPEKTEAVNPFEIARKKLPEAPQNGIENPAMDMPVAFAIALPFTPTVGCRIDFGNVGVTPTKMLAEKLVFTPPNGKPNSAVRRSFRRSLSVISEETVDIGKELDCYQLELENSINEAKILKEQGRSPRADRRSNNFEARLTNVAEVEVIEEENVSVTEISIEINLSKDFKESATKGGSLEKTEDCRQSAVGISETEGKVEAEAKEEEEEEDIASEDSFDDQIDFKVPAPFVRAYRKPVPQNTKEVTKESASKDVSDHANKSKESNKQKVGDVIRKSIRKLMRKDSKPLSNEEKENIHHEEHHLFDAIRQSFRRKPKIPVEEKITEHEISILDGEQRKLFRSKENGENKVVNEPSPNDRKSLRRSLRKSTKGVKNHLMKSVFKRNVEEYDLPK